MTTGDGRLLDPLVRRWTAIGTAVALAVYAVMATLGRPWRLLADPHVFTQDFFDLQANAFRHGHLAVPAGSLSFEGFVTPGGTHMYFGVVPALLRVPIRLVTSWFDGRLGTLSCMAALAIVCVCTARIARRSQRRLQVDASHRWYAVIAAAPVVLSPALYLASRPLVYHEAVAWGAAGAVWGIDATMQWWYGRTRHQLVWALVAATVAVNARPSVGLAPLLMLAALAVVLATRRHWRPMAAAAGAGFAAFATYALVDHARFGQWWGAPSNLQLSNGIFPDQAAASRLTGNSLISLRFLPTTLDRYLDPFSGGLRTTRLFPFLELKLGGRAVGGVPMQLGGSSSLVWAAPLLVALAVVGGVWVVRRGDTAWRAAAGAAALATVPTLAFWAVWQRYLVDFLPVLVVLAAPGGWLVLRWVAARDRRARAVAAAFAASLAVIGLAGQLSLGLWSRAFLLPGHTQELARVTELRYRLDDWLFDGPPPHVFHVAPGDLGSVPAGHQGDLAIEGECRSISINDLGWRPFQVTSGDPADTARFCRSLLERTRGR